MGPHTGLLLLPDGTGLPPTGKRVQMRGMELGTRREDRRRQPVLHNLAVIAQLGLGPRGVPASA